MATIKVVSLKDFPYNGIPRPEGKTYDVEEGHLALLEQIGVAVRYVAPKRSYRRRDMQAERTVDMTPTIEVSPTPPTEAEPEADTGPAVETADPSDD